MSSLHLTTHSDHFITPCSSKNYHLRPFQSWRCVGLNGHVADRSRAKLDMWVMHIQVLSGQISLPSNPHLPELSSLGLMWSLEAANSLRDLCYNSCYKTYRFML